MEKKELKERFFDRFFYAEDGSHDWDRWRNQDPSVVLEFILEELDKAREEGFRNCYKEVLAMDSFGEKMDMSRKESFRRLKNLLEDKIRLKLTTK